MRRSHVLTLVSVGTWSLFLSVRSPSLFVDSTEGAVARPANPVPVNKTARMEERDGSAAVGGTSCGDDADCEDGDPCTLNSCNATGVCIDMPAAIGTPCGDLVDTVCNPLDTCDGQGACVVRTTNDGAPCLDDLFCNGREVCLDGECTDGPEPCVDLAHCNEATNRCRSCVEAEECDDRNPCTSNACILNVCVFTTIPDCTTCASDGVCDDENDCSNDACVGATTTESGRCENTPVDDGASCADELFCNGPETCRDGECEDGDDPCVDLTHCDEVNNGCLECLSDAECDDQNPCSTNLCIENECQFMRIPGCRPCTTDADCDDVNECTSERCVSGGEGLGVCEYSPLAQGTPCDEDDVACTADVCDGSGECLHPPDHARCDDDNPCTDGECDPVHGGCLFPPDDTNSCEEDGDLCTVDRCANEKCLTAIVDCKAEEVCRFFVCNPATGQCELRVARPDTPCPDELFCNGEERCDGNGTCVPGGPPCVDARACDEDNHRCIECTTDDNCEDDNPCTSDECAPTGLCVYANRPPGTPCPDDLFCNGEETCDGKGVCRPGSNPCENGEVCLEGFDRCAECVTDADCNDGNLCTTEECQGLCVYTFLPTNTPCPDDEFCNGEETCDGRGTCTAGEPPCPPGVVCDEVVDRCTECDDEAPNGRRIICHIPPGNPVNARTLRVGQAAVPAHLAHGDTPGPCPGDCPNVGSCADRQSVVVDLDIMPGSCPNALQVHGKSVLTMALVGGCEGGVREIDVASIRLWREDGVGHSIRPQRQQHTPFSRLEDVASPIVEVECSCHAAGADGILDLSVTFSGQDLERDLKLDEVASRSNIRLILRGELTDGTLFEVSDCVTIE